MSAVPERAESDKSKLALRTRVEKMRDSVSDEFFEPDMPSPGNAEYLLAHLWAVGPTSGDAAISSTELRNYQDNMGIKLSPWECATLRRLSIDYLNESHRSTKADCPPPFGDSTDAARLRNAELQRKLNTFLD
ncbi:MAG: hypothetical protein ABIT83_17550 [Massilia sp.]